MTFEEKEKWMAKNQLVLRVLNLMIVGVGSTIAGVFVFEFSWKLSFYYSLGLYVFLTLFFESSYYVEKRSLWNLEVSKENLKVSLKTFVAVNLEVGVDAVEFVSKVSSGSYLGGSSYLLTVDSKVYEVLFGEGFIYLILGGEVLVKSKDDLVESVG